MTTLEVIAFIATPLGAVSIGAAAGFYRRLQAKQRELEDEQQDTWLLREESKRLKARISQLHESMGHLAQEELNGAKAIQHLEQELKKWKSVAAYGRTEWELADLLNHLN